MFEAVAFEERHGKPGRRAGWRAPKAALTYSGVPNAGDPDFMSTFDVKLPYTIGAPGLTIWARVSPASASACASVSAPAIVTGAISPASQTDGMMTTCPAVPISTI